MSTPTSLIIAATSGTSLASLAIAEAAGAEPWAIAAVVVPLAGFTGWLVRWILQRQDDREKANSDRESRRELREEKRAEQAELQTRAMQQCVIELQELSAQQKDHAKALADVPHRLLELLEKRPA